MGSLNDILTIARSGVLSHQERMAVISHNIANVNTPGYRRQIALLGTNPPNEPNIYTSRDYDLGTGVRVLDVIRAYDDTKERQYLNLSSTTSSDSKLADILPGVENLIGAAVDGATLATHLGNFWAAWQDVATNPTNTAMRNVLLERSATLTSALNSVSGNLADFQSRIIDGVGPYTGAIPSTVDEINSLAVQVADLNRKITFANALNIDANDLMDQRNTVLRDLGELTNITLEQDYGVSIDGSTLVTGDGQTTNILTITASSPPQFSLNGNPVTITGGELNAWVLATSMTGQVGAELDSLTAELINQVNTLHAAGFDLNGNAGVPFFTGTGAGDISINIALYDYTNPFAGHPEMIAAAATVDDPGPPIVPNVGDGAQALAIADLCRATFMALGGKSFSDFYTGIATTVGAQVAEAASRADRGQSALDAFSNAIQGSDGVNLDEELIDLMAAQRAFEASSRVAGVADRLMDIVINTMAR